jgi:hypothetical protein
VLSFNRSIPIISRNRTIAIRQVSWFPTIFRVTEKKSPSPNSTGTPTKPSPASAVSFSRQGPEQILTAALQDAVEIRRKEKEAESNKIEQQLKAYGESEPINESTPESFRDPLGHLTFEEQVQYLARPPPEYLEDLLERARRREDFDQTIYTADPVNHWHLCYSSKPDFGKESLPPWIPWNPERRLEVMEKFRRYDERFQLRLQNIYRSYDSEEFRSNLKRTILIRLRKEIQREKVASAKRAKRSGKDALISSNIEDLPLAVLEVKVYREMIKMRNTALKKAQAKFMAELTVFEDISEDGVLASVEKQMNMSKMSTERKREIMKHKEALQEWSSLSTDIKAESVNWGAIYNEE